MLRALKDWFRGKRSPKASGKRLPRRTRLVLERLEMRCLPSIDLGGLFGVLLGGGGPTDQPPSLNDPGAGGGSYDPNPIDYSQNEPGVQSDPIGGIEGLTTSTVTVLPVGLPPAGREFLGAGVPVVDARLLIAAQHTADFFRDLLATRRLRLQQPGEHLAQLRHR